jgi:hypothetical protein
MKTTLRLSGPYALMNESGNSKMLSRTMSQNELRRHWHSKLQEQLQVHFPILSPLGFNDGSHMATSSQTLTPLTSSYEAPSGVSQISQAPDIRLSGFGTVPCSSCHPPLHFEVTVHGTYCGRTCSRLMSRWMTSVLVLM